MGGFLIPNTTISGGVANPGIPFHDSPDGGLYETASGGIGIALAGGAFFELDFESFLLGYKAPKAFAMAVLPSSPYVTGLAPHAIAFSPNGTFLFSANDNGSNVNVFARNFVTGALVNASGSPVGTGVSTPLSVVTTINGKYLFVGNATSNTQISGYQIDPITGALSALAGSPFNVLALDIYSMVVSPDGQWLFVVGKANGKDPQKPPAFSAQEIFLFQ